MVTQFEAECDKFNIIKFKNNTNHFRPNVTQELKKILISPRPFKLLFCIFSTSRASRQEVTLVFLQTALGLTPNGSKNIVFVDSDSCPKEFDARDKLSRREQFI